MDTSLKRNNKEKYTVWKLGFSFSFQSYSLVYENYSHSGQEFSRHIIKLDLMNDKGRFFLTHFLKTAEKKHVKGKTLLYSIKGDYKNHI